MVVVILLLATLALLGARKMAVEFLGVASNSAHKQQAVNN